jgi:hypothetical protein
MTVLAATEWPLTRVHPLIGKKMMFVKSNFLELGV